MPVFDLLAEPLQANGFDKEGHRRRVAELLEIVGLPRGRQPLSGRVLRWPETADRHRTGAGLGNRGSWPDEPVPALTSHPGRHHQPAAGPAARVRPVLTSSSRTICRWSSTWPIRSRVMYRGAIVEYGDSEQVLPTRRMSTPGACWPRSHSRIPPAVSICRCDPSLRPGRPCSARSFSVAGCASNPNRTTGSAGGNAELGKKATSTRRTRRASNRRQPAAGDRRAAVELQHPEHRRQRGRDRRDVAVHHAARVLHRAGRVDEGQHRLLHQRRTDQHQAAGGHLHHQPEGHLVRRHPITWEDIAAQINATNGKDKAFAITAPNGSDQGGVGDRGGTTARLWMTFAQNYLRSGAACSPATPCCCPRA